MMLLSTHALEVWRYDKTNPASAEGYWDKGKWIDPQRVPHVIGGTIYPAAKGKHESLDGDFAYTKDAVRIRSTQPIFAADTATGQDADLIKINGLMYEVKEAEDWNIGFMAQTRHYKSTADRRPDLDGENCYDKCK